MPQYKIDDAGDTRKYFSQIPHLVDDKDLSVYAYRLYGHLKRVAGDNGTCWQSVKTLSESCRMSSGMVTKAREELNKSGLIRITRSDNPHGGRDFISITLIDIWSENMVKYANSQSEQASSYSEVASSPHEQASSPGEIKNNTNNKNTPIKNNPKKNTPAKAGAPKIDPINLFPIAKALAEVTGMDFDKNKGRVFRAAKDYKLEEIDKIKTDYGYGGLWYLCDWRGLKGQPPTLSLVRETWGNLKMPEQHKTGNGHIPYTDEDPTERAKIDAAFSKG